MENKNLLVVGGLIVKKNKILICQRSSDNDHPLKWEFPGGKVEEGERPEDAVIREVKEELQLDINPVASIGRVVYEYPDSKVDLTLFHCALLDGLPILKEHNDLRWTDKSLLYTFDWSAADRELLQLAGWLD